MSTVGKAMALLDAFDLRHPDLGLTEIARAVGYDKATTRRLLVQLCAHGMIEHDALSRRYRLGPALSGWRASAKRIFPSSRSPGPSSSNWRKPPAKPPISPNSTAAT